MENLRNLEMVTRDAEKWASLMDKAYRYEIELAETSVEDGLPPLPTGLIGEEAMRNEKRFWYAAVLEEMSIANFTLALTNFKESKEKFEATHASLLVQKKKTKETFTGQKRAVTSLAKEKLDSVRTYKADAEERETKLTDLKEELDLATRDFVFANTNNESDEVVSRLKAKKDNLTNQVETLQLDISDAQNAHEANMARLEKAFRKADRSSSSNKRKLEQTEDRTDVAHKGLFYFKEAEIHCKKTLSMCQRRFLYLVKKLHDTHVELHQLSEVRALTLLALLPSEVVGDRLEGFEIKFSISENMWEEFRDRVCKEIGFISKETIKVDCEHVYSLKITHGKCTFKQIVPAE